MPIPLIAKIGLGAAAVIGLLYASTAAKASTKPSGTAPTGKDPKLAYAKGLADGKAAGEFDFTNGSPKGTTGYTPSVATASGSPEDYKRGFAIGAAAGYDAAKLAAAGTTGAKAISDVIGAFAKGSTDSEVVKSASGDSSNPDLNAAYAKKANEAGRLQGQIDGTRDGNEHPLGSAPSPNCRPDPGQTWFYRSHFCDGYMEAYPYYFAKAQDERRSAGAASSRTYTTDTSASDEDEGFGTSETAGYGTRTGVNIVGRDISMTSFGPVYRRRQVAVSPETGATLPAPTDRPARRLAASPETGSTRPVTPVDMAKVRSAIDSGRMPVEKARALATAMAHHGQFEEAKALKAYYWRKNRPVERTSTSGWEDQVRTGAVYDTQVSKMPPWFRRPSAATQAQRFQPVKRNQQYVDGYNSGMSDCRSGLPHRLERAWGYSSPMTRASDHEYWSGYDDAYRDCGVKPLQAKAPGSPYASASQPQPQRSLAAMQAQPAKLPGEYDWCYLMGLKLGRVDVQAGRAFNYEKAVAGTLAMLGGTRTAEFKTQCARAIASGYRNGWGNRIH